MPQNEDSESNEQQIVYIMLDNRCNTSLIYTFRTSYFMAWDQQTSLLSH